MNSTGSDYGTNERSLSTATSDKDRYEQCTQYEHSELQESACTLRSKKRRLIRNMEVAQWNEADDGYHSSTSSDATHINTLTNMSNLEHLAVASNAFIATQSFQEEEEKEYATGEQSMGRAFRLEKGAATAQYITVDMLRPHFDKPLNDVAKIFGICSTLMKKVCRRLQIRKWPYRQILSLRRSVVSMKKQVDYFDGERKVVYSDQMNKQQRKLDHLLRTGNALEESGGCSRLTNSEQYRLPRYIETTTHSVNQESLTHQSAYGTASALLNNESEVRPILPSISYLLNRQHHDNSSDEPDSVPFPLHSDHTF